MGSGQAPGGFEDLERRYVGLALDDGNRLDDCVLISASRPGVTSVWLLVGGIDVFVPRRRILAVWERPRPTPARRPPAPQTA